MRFQQVVLATQVATPQDMVPCHQQVLDIQRQGQAILRGDRAIPLQPQDILLVGYPLQLATQLGALLLHQVVPLDTPPNPSQVTPRHQGEVIQVLKYMFIDLKMTVSVIGDIAGDGDDLLLQILKCNLY